MSHLHRQMMAQAYLAAEAAAAAPVVEAVATGVVVADGATITAARPVRKRKKAKAIKRRAK
jgi:hypothetical protein